MKEAPILFMTSLFEVLLPLQLESLSQERAWQIWRPTVLCNYAKKMPARRGQKREKKQPAFPNLCETFNPQRPHWQLFCKMTSKQL